MRVGIGYDIHALKKGRGLVLGGVRIPFPRGLAGHSDGDVLTHAIADAVLGAMGGGDLGNHFPDTDARWRGADSFIFVKGIRQMLKKRRLKIAHVDSVIIAEEPKLADHKMKIQQNLAKALGLQSSQVSVKAKTNEGFGALGKKQAIACYAVVSLK